MELNPRNTKVNIQLVVWTAIVIFILCMVCILLRIKLEGLLDQHITKQVMQQSELVAKLVDEKFQVRLESMIEMARHFENDPDCMESMIQSASNDHTIRYGALSLDGDMYTKKPAEKVFVEDFPCVAESFRGKKTFCYHQDKGFLFSVPVYHGRNVRYVLYKLYSDRTADGFFNNDCITEKCSMTVLNEDGLPALESKSGSWRNDSIWQTVDYSRIYEKLGHLLNGLRSTVVGEDIGGERYYFFSVNLNYFNFTLIGMVSKQMVARGMARVPLLVFWVVGMLVVLFMTGIFIWFLVDRRRRENFWLRQEAISIDERSQENLSLLRSIGNEIRGPLSNIISMSSVIAKENQEPTLKDYTHDILGSGQMLKSLTDSLDDIVKIESDSMEIMSAEYDLYEVLSDCYTAANNVNRAEIFQLEVDSRIPSRLIGDEIRLRQIIGNIFFNAEKISPNGKASIIIDYDRITDGGEWNGEKINLIIKIPGSGVGWTGIGLTLAKRLTLLMGGVLRQDAMLSGSPAFMIVIPQQVAKNDAIGDFKRRYEESSMLAENGNRYFYAPNASILAIDEMIMNLRVMSGMLKETCVHMDAVSNGMEALEKFKRNHYDIVFLDHTMPVIDGMDLFTIMKGLTDHPNKDTPIVMLTADSETIARQICMKVGYADFLTVPVREETLFATLLKFLSKNLVQWYEITPEEDKPEEQSPARSDGLVADKRIPSRPEVLTSAIPETPMLPDDLENLMTTDLVDVLIGLECCQKNEAIYRKKLMDYANEHVDAALDVYCKAEDYENYRLLVHVLKTKSLYIGAVEIASICKSLEFACNEGNYDIVRNRHDRLVQKYKQLMQIFKELF